MNIKLLAVDIDGTLVTKNKELTEITKNAIKKYIKGGGKFAIATGRPNKGIERYIDELNLHELGGYVISYNGSRIFDAKTGELLYQKNLKPSQLPQIFDAAEKYNINLTTYKGDTAVTEKADDKYFNLEVSINKLSVKRVTDLKKEITYPIPKFLITGESEYLIEIEKRLKKDLFGVSVFRSEPFFLEITPNGVDKGEAFLWLSDYMGIMQNETMACGDGFNDITLLKAAGTGVAMENAQDITKNSADFVTLSNDENGVAYAINKFIF